MCSRAERCYEIVVMTAAVAIVGISMLRWRTDAPDLNIVAVIALALVPVAVRFQITISRGDPVLTLGVSSAALFASDMHSYATTLPIWAGLVAASYALFHRDETAGQFRAAIQILGGAALLEMARQVDFGYRPFDRAIPALASYFLTITILEMLRRFVSTDEDSVVLRLRWTWVLPIVLGVYYTSAAIVMIRNTFNGSPIPIIPALSIALAGAVSLVVGVALRNRQLSRGLSSVIDAATAMPWRRDAIVPNLRIWAMEALRARDVHVSSELGSRWDINVALGAGEYLVATRDRGDLPFSQVERDMLDALAHMATSAAREADQRDHLMRRATTDGLTGLATYTHFREQLDELNKVRDDDEKLGLIFIDLDDFKEVNDRFGHLGGDRVIREIGWRLKNFSTDGLVTRFGGDEFAVVFRHVDDLAGLNVLADRILKLVAEPVVIGDDVARLRASIGVAFSGAVEENVGDLVHEANRHMYRRKGSLQASKDESRIRLDEAVRTAIVDRRIEAAFQPIADLKEGTIEAFEALVRVTDPELGPIPPETVVAIAVRLNLLDELTRQVAGHAFATAAEAQAMGLGVRTVNINIEFSQIESWSPLLDRLVELSNTSDVHLVLEISERSFGHWGLRNDDVVHRLTESSISIAIDDFGAGYSSLGSLHLSPVSTVKIDKSMVSGIASGRQQLIVGRVIAMLGELKLETVVEGIETAADAEVVRSLGGRYGQGHYFGVPAPREQFIELLRTHGRIAIP